MLNLLSGENITEEETPFVSRLASPFAPSKYTRRQVNNGILLVAYELLPRTSRELCGVFFSRAITVS